MCRKDNFRKKTNHWVAKYILPIFLLIAFSNKALAGYWIDVWETGQVEEAAKVADAIDENWAAGGRLTQVLVRRTRDKSFDADSYKIYVGVYPDIAQAVKVAMHILDKQPWRSTGVFCSELRLISTGSFEPIGIRFTSELADALKPDEKNGFPYLAEALTAAGFGFREPSASIPDLVTSNAQIKAWDRVLVLEESSVCGETRRIVGGSPPRSPGSKGPAGPPVVHEKGERCIRWLYAMTENPLALAWFPAANVAAIEDYRKARAQSRWGPVNFLYLLNRIGTSPSGIIYQGVFRTGAFPPVIERIVVPRKYPEPHRLVHDELGFAVYEGKGRVLQRLTINPPPPGISPVWRKSSETRRTYK